LRLFALFYEEIVMKYVIALLSCLLIAFSAIAQEAPKGPAPILKVVTSVDSAKGLIHFKVAVTRYVPVAKEIEVEANGQKVKQTVTEFVAEVREETHAIETAKSRIIAPNGKQIPNEDLWKRVKANTVVVISGDGNAPAAEYLRTLHPDTVVIIPAAAKN
jgi:hypothetical protein